MKQILHKALLFLLLMSLLSLPGRAAEVVASGSCGEKGDHMRWVLTDDGTLTISGTGDMEDYTEPELAPWYPHAQNITRVVVSPGIHSVGRRAFYGYAEIRELTLGEGLRFIDKYAFRDCDSLTEVAFPAGLEQIGIGAFRYCDRLTTLRFQEGLRVVDEKAFEKCLSLTSVTLPATVEIIGPEAFYRCEALQQITLSRELRSLGDRSFARTCLNTLVLPEEVAELGHELASETSLESIHFLGDAPRIQEDTFLDCGTPELCIDPLRSGWEGEIWQGAISCRYTRESTATCSEMGTIRITCSHCAAEFTTAAPGGHSYGPWHTAQEPTEVTPGSWQRICTRCQAPESMPIPAAPQIPQISTNLRMHDYPSYASRLTNSYLRDNGDGTFTRIEALADHVTVEQYDGDWNFLSRRVLPMELPEFGGFYEGADHFYLAFGQENWEENDTKDVIRVVCYSKDWVRLGQASVPGYEIAHPFDRGCLQMTEHQGLLYVHTSHERYRTPDGANHQSDLLFSLPISAVSRPGEAVYIVPTANKPNRYVSHSFSQFILASEEGIAILNQGDEDLRCAVIHQFRPGEEAIIHPILWFTDSESFLYNRTGASLGAFLLSQSSYLTAGNSILQDGTVEMDGQRNIFLGVTNRQMTDDSEVLWFTSYPDGANVDVSNPHMISVGAERFLLMWNEGTLLRYCFVSGEGRMQGQILEAEGISLSDCTPILAGGRVCWYVTNQSLPLFCWLELAAPETVHTHHTHTMVWQMTQEPTMEAAGLLNLRCALCGTETDQAPLPPLNEQDYTLTVLEESTCDHRGTGLFTWDTPEHGQFQVEARLPKPEHLYGEWIILTAPTCVSQGLQQRTCTGCGKTDADSMPKTDHSYSPVVTAPTCTEKGFTTHTCQCGKAYTDSIVPALGHSMGEWIVAKDPTCLEGGEKMRHCSRCDYTETSPISATGHTCQDSVTAPTCTEPGYTTHACPCGYAYTDSETAPLGHDFGEWIVIQEATEEAEGEERRICARCDEAESRPIPRLAHTHKYAEAVTKPTCTEGGFTTHACPCGYAYTDSETAPLGHDFGKWVVIREATEEAEGEERRICTRCDEAESRPIPRLAHTHKYAEAVTEPTCTEGGFTTHACPCGYAYTDSETAPLGHDFGEWIVIREATEEAEGEERRNCARCDEAESRAIPRLAHTHKYAEAVTEPTCTEGGFTTHACPCGYAYTDSETAPLGHRFSEGLCLLCGDVDPDYTAPVDNPFGDVEEGQWYFEPVLWAVERGITSGTSATTFAPNNPCTRAQVVTFLWRAMGQPEPTLTENPFSDVKESDYFCKAVLWAVENGITSGTGNGRFSPGNPCTRAQVVTFLWRTMGKPAPEKTDSPFSDVPEGIYYYEPVLWAVENGITSGTSAATFSPSSPCTRAQVVTFLYRTLKQP